jgi:hypothetical protein
LNVWGMSEGCSFFRVSHIASYLPLEMALRPFFGFNEGNRGTGN